MAKGLSDEFLEENRIKQNDASLSAEQRPVSGSEEASDRSYLDGLQWGTSQDEYRMDNN